MITIENLLAIQKEKEYLQIIFKMKKIQHKLHKNRYSPNRNGRFSFFINVYIHFQLILMKPFFT